MSTRDAVRLEIEELEALREELEKRVAAEATIAATAAETPRWNADPEDVKRSVGRLVLTLVELIRRLLERQTIRRMEAETLTPEEIEALGQALMKLEETVQSLAETFGLDPSELNLDLGPLGKLL